MRAPALLLLAIFTGTLLSPFFEASARSELPACCRRDGSHKCAQMRGATGRGVAAAKCASYPGHFGAWAASASAALPPAASDSQAFRNSAASPAPLVFQSEPVRRANGSRGPPSFLA